MRHIQHIALGGDTHRHLAEPIGLTAIGTKLGDGVHSDEAVTTPCAAEFRRFEDKRATSPSGETLIESDRCQGIGEQSTHDGDDAVPLIGEFMELLTGRPGPAPTQILDAALLHHFASSGLKPSTTGSGPPSSKQLRLPVWHAAPT